ncbi:MAG: amidohydrolase [Parvularculaceae bacterium]
MRIATLALLAVAVAGCAKPPDKPADVILSGGVIYTADAGRTVAEAIAVRGDSIIHVGSAKDAERFAGPQTRRVDLGGKLVLPGFHDLHLHPVSAMAVDTCSINRQAMTLAELSYFVARCIARFGPPAGEWLYVDLWAFDRGNQPDDRFRTIRAALDAAAPLNPVFLEGTDGHHFAANSLALATAKNADGAVVGLSAATLKSDFADLAHYVGVDETGEPNGKLTESYIYDRLDVAAMERAELDKRIASREKMMEVTLPRGITSFLDAAARPETLPIYDALLERGEFKARARLALFLDPSKFRRSNGSFDGEALIAEATALREKYVASPLVQADYLKLFADGVLEGDPLSTPPTLPNAAFSRDYLQPNFKNDDAGLRVVGYVDPNGEICAATRRLSAGGALTDVSAFMTEHGFHPQQCMRSSGALQHPEEVIHEFIRLGHEAAFTFNIHAIGDRAVKTALDAIEKAQAAGGYRARHIVTHLQLVRPEDVRRFNALGAYASFTFAWATIDPEYDLTVIPFINRVDGPGGLYDPQSYYIKNVYPAESIRKAGGVIIAGSDAPVDTRDPRPFVNIEGAVARDIFGEGPLNAAEALSIRDAIDAYTINGARALKQDLITGSLEKGKRADFIILDQNIIDLAEQGEADRISETKVLETWFDGRRVYAADE